MVQSIVQSPGFEVSRIPRYHTGGILPVTHGLWTGLDNQERTTTPLVRQVEYAHMNVPNQAQDRRIVHCNFIVPVQPNCAHGKHF